MKLYRRGPLYLAMHSPADGFVFDASTGRTRNVLPALFLGADAREWPPVLDSDPLPPGLRARLVLPFPGDTPPCRDRAT